MSSFTHAGRIRSMVIAGGGILADSTRNKARYNCKKYKAILYRVPRGSELAAALEEQAHNGDSVNFTITRLLADYYGVDIPQGSYKSRETRQIIP